MIKAIIALLFMFLGGYGFIWWHEALGSSGGPDMGRSAIQYIIPYFITSVIFLIGLFFGIQSAKRFAQR
jgi:hypothetical protein